MVKDISVKAARINAGLKQEEVCKKLGMCKNVWLKYENGGKPMTEELVRKFAAICGCSPSDLDCDVLVLTKASTLS